MSQFAKLFETVKADPKSKSGADKIKQKNEDITDNSKQKRQSRTASVAKTNIVGEKVQTHRFGDATGLAGATEQVEKADGISTISPQLSKEKVTGKSRNTDYAQVLTYLRKDTHRAAKKILIDDPQQRNLSDLVEQLLDEWIKKSKKI